MFPGGCQVGYPFFHRFMPQGAGAVEEVPVAIIPESAYTENGGQGTGG